MIILTFIDDGEDDHNDDHNCNVDDDDNGGDYDGGDNDCTLSCDVGKNK